MMRSKKIKLIAKFFSVAAFYGAAGVLAVHGRGGRGMRRPGRRP
jgi:hypothetical protein